MLSADGLCNKYGQVHLVSYLNFITFDPTGELACVDKETVDHHASCYPYKVALLSCPNSSLTTNICSSHTLIFQAGSNIGIYQLETVGSSCFALDFNPISSFELKGDNDEQLDHSAVGGNNSFFRWKTSWNSPACQHTIYPPHLEPDIIWLHKS